MSDPLEETRRRIDALLNIEIPEMVSRGQLSDPQLFETIGVLGLWMRAVLGTVEPEIQNAVDAFLEAVRAASPKDARPLGAKLHVQLEGALRDNPALVALKGHIEEAMSAEASNDPAVRASQAFVTYATRAESSPDVVAYFELLANAH